MTELLYMDDSYLKEFEAEVVEVSGDRVVLDRTAFYPVGGGLPSDTGVLLKGSEEYRVEEVRKEGGKVWHIVPGHSLSPGDGVRGVIDWDRRYRVMRMHTALHALIAVMNQKFGVLVTGNKVAPDRSRVDVNLEKPDRELVEKVIAETNEELAKGLPVKIYYLPREEAMKIPGIVKLARALPPSVQKLRIVEIEGLDIQADGGPHVSNTKEVGRIVFLRLENKGKNNRRIHFTLEP
ncbi:MAG: alanyl-tRNA editing protein AlaXM [Candidatus Korarchaeota archaeon]|nr:alanyl-tRNA editing protein AlaXM [Candidatus Korarchaeota archaeon]